MSAAALAHISMACARPQCCWNRHRPDCTEQASARSCSPPLHKLWLAPQGCTEVKWLALTAVRVPSVLQANVSLVDILRRTAFLPEGLTPNLDRSLATEVDSAVVRSPWTTGEVDSEPAISSITRMDQKDLLPLPQASAASSASQAGSSSAVGASLNGSSTGSGGKSVVMRDLSETGASFWRDGADISTTASTDQAWQSYSGSQYVAVVNSQEADKARTASRRGLKSLDDADAQTDSNGSLSASAAIPADPADNRQLRSQLVKEGVIESPTPPNNGTAAPAASASAASTTNGAGTSQQPQGASPAAATAKWVAVDQEFEEATQWLSFLRCLAHCSSAAVSPLGQNFGP